MTVADKIRISGLRLCIGGNEVLKGIDLAIKQNAVTGFMGPSGSGKSSLISILNRMIDFEERVEIAGEVLINDESILGKNINVTSLRRKVGTVFAVPLPLPRSIYENVAFGPLLKGTTDKDELHEIVVESLKKAVLFEEVRDRLHTSGLKLSGGQQQRLCLARTLALKPEIILLDEPCSGLDPISTAKIEEALSELKKEYTIVLVSNNTKQIARATDYAAFFYMGELVEGGATPDMFTNPAQKRTSDYIEGKFG